MSRQWIHIEAYIVFYQGGTIDHGTHVPVPFSQLSAESEYNASCTAVMDLANFRMLIHEFLSKYSGIFPEESPLTIPDGKYAVFMANNSKDNKHNSHISRRVNFVINGEKFKIHNIGWCKEGLKLACISTKNVVENYLNTRMKYIMVKLDK